MKKRPFKVPERMPGTGETPESVWNGADGVWSEAAEAYLIRRGVTPSTALEAGIRYHECYRGRPALLAVMRDREDGFCTLHGRYIEVRRGESKMLSIGTGDGVINMLGGWRAEPFIIVEGLFDALSLAMCGYPAAATVGCWSGWLPQAALGRVVWLGFDRCGPGEEDARRYGPLFAGADVRRLVPPPLCKDWNTALRKRGVPFLKSWLRRSMNMEA